MTDATRSILALAGLLLAAPAAAQEAEDPDVPRTVAPARPEHPASPLVGEVQVDGLPDDPVWSTVPVVSGFVQAEPIEGDPAEDDTEVRIAIGESAIYVLARMHDRAPDEIDDRLVRRDQEGSYDWFSFQVDPNLDQRTAYAFRVSAANVQRDEYIYDDNRSDEAWDAVWESSVTRDEDGWIAEMRIPLSQIRYEASDDPQTWGVNFVRRRVASAELSYFALKSRLKEGRVSQFGTLEEVEVGSGRRRMEARPYVLSRMEQGPAEAGDPFFDGRSASARVGADLRLGLTSAFTLDATVNPDFGQVEADPAVINLSDVETFLEERRPFFVEDAQIFNFQLSGRQNALFYSRRIGRAPTGGAPPGSEFEEVPDAASILGAAKVTGRTSGGLSLGVLAAATDTEYGRATPEAGAPVGEFMVEPSAQFGVVRAQQDLNDGASQVGVIATGMRRDLPTDGIFDHLASSAFSAGIGFEHQWANRTWNLNGFLAGSHVRGDSLAMIRVQRSSNHYFQRPDRTAGGVDSTATSLSGLEWRLSLNRQNGRHWTGGLWLGQLTDGFEINDVGYSRSSERLDAGMRISYREIRPGSLFRSYNVNFFTFHNWSHEALDAAGSLDSWRDAYMRGSANLMSRFELLNYWGINADLSLSPDGFSRSATRGGPVMKDPGSARVQLRFNSDRRKPVTFGAGIESRTGFDDSGSQFSIGGEVSVRPSPRIEVSLQPRWATQRDGAQYVTSTSTLPYDATFGRRYLFAEIERTTVSMETRVDVSLSPTLTFQLFAQPLLSSGDYVRYRQLSAAREYDFVDFDEGSAVVDGETVTCEGGSICSVPSADGADRQHLDFDGDGEADYSFRDRDFNVRSLIGNAVLRWEYRPGSTIFFVWQRQQAGRVSTGDFDFGRDLGQLWDAPAQNVFMVKVNYWLGR